MSKITVLISGEGTNLQALINACDTSFLPDTEIIRVISNKKSAKGLERAKSASIPTRYQNLLSYGKSHPSSDPSTKYGAEAREAYDADLANLVLQNPPDLVVCAGFMHVLSDMFLRPMVEADTPVINLHPALPGQFNGINAIERAWESGRQGNLSKTGVMVHYIIRQVDCGEPIVTEEVELRENESLEDLKSRMHIVEHRLIVEGTRRALERLQAERAKET